MEFRLAVIEDLPQIQSMYRKIVQRMDENRIQIWDDIYPCAFFEGDIQKKQLYLMLEHDKIVSAFVLCHSNPGEDYAEWNDSSAKALYIDRLGVNTDCLRRGIGSFTLTKAKETAKALGAEYLRLFVVDINAPAIRLYSQNGFTRVNGIYKEVVDAELALQEYGYEIKL